MEEYAPRKRLSPWYLICFAALYAVLALTYSFLPSVPLLRLGYQLVTIGVSAVVIYSYVGGKTYRYRVDPDGVGISLCGRNLNGGEAEPLLFIPTEAIVSAVPYRSDLARVPRRSRYGVSNQKKACLLVYREAGAEKSLLFQPSDEFVKILQQIVLDKSEKM